MAGVLLNDKALFGEWFFFYLRLGINTEGLHELAIAYIQSRSDARRSSFSLFKSIIHQWAQTKGSRATLCSLVNFLRKMQHGSIAGEYYGNLFYRNSELFQLRKLNQHFILCGR